MNIQYRTEFSASMSNAESQKEDTAASVDPEHLSTSEETDKPGDKRPKIDSSPNKSKHSQHSAVDDVD